MTDAEREQEVRRLVAERFGNWTAAEGPESTDQQGEAPCTEDLAKIHNRARIRLQRSAGRRLATWPVADRAGSLSARTQTAPVFLTGARTASARSAQHGPDSPASRSQDG